MWIWMHPVVWKLNSDLKDEEMIDELNKIMSGTTDETETETETQAAE